LVKPDPNFAPWQPLVLFWSYNQTTIDRQKKIGREKKQYSSAFFSSSKESAYYTAVAVQLEQI
jgi:hypothetical protein